MWPFSCYHSWRYEMSGPLGMERDCCEKCWARRYRGCGSSVVEDHEGWRKSPPLSPGERLELAQR
jgi:hypothetical protein